MKKFLIGFLAGSVAVLLLILLSMLDGTPFKSTLLKSGIGNGRGIIFTERFVVVYEGMQGDDAQASYFTYAGKNGTIPAFWRGFSQGWSGSDQGIDTLETYDPGFAVATLFFHGKILRVEEDGRYLHVQLQRLPISQTQVVAVVEKDGSCRQLTGAEAAAMLQSLPSWYKDTELNARPPAPKATTGHSVSGQPAT